MPGSHSDRLSSLDLVEAFHLGHAVWTLHDLGLFAALRKPSTAEELADRVKLDAVLLLGVLEFVAARTDLLRKTGKRFVTTNCYTKPCCFLLDLYAGAYRNHAFQLGTLLKSPSRAAQLVDRTKHARAFANVDSEGFAAMAQIIQQLQFNHVLDVGCGSGALLVYLAERDPQFIAWGLDVNPEMCKSARARIRAARAGKRIKVIEGDSARLDEFLSEEIRSQIEIVTASQVANEMFGRGTDLAVSWLSGLRQSLPGRRLLLADYYGRLGGQVKQIHRETIFHDYVQLIAGQGIPPADVGAWQSIYSKSGCRLMHVIEDTSTTRFIHLVQL